MPAVGAAPTAPTTTVADARVDELRHVVLRLARRIRTSSVDTITPSQLAILATVDRLGPVTIGHLAEIEHVRPPSVSKIVGALEEAGFVERLLDPDDRRCVRVTTTQAGREYFEQLRAAGRSWLASRLAELDPPDVAAIVAALPALQRLLGGTG